MKSKIIQLVSKFTNIKEEEITLEIPQNESLGDYAFACFKLAKELKKSPAIIASELAVQISSSCLEFLTSVAAVGAYINFKVNPAQVAKLYFERLESKTDSPFDSKSDFRTQGGNKTILIDYSSVNIAKQFHMGHLSTTVIGASLYRLYNFLGFKAIGINHLGDYGSQFGKLIYAYKLWGIKGEINLDSLTALYQRFTKEAKENEELDKGGKLWFKRLEDGDTEALEVFEQFKRITLGEVAKIYEQLDAKFDYYTGESFYSDKLGAVYSLLESKGLLSKKDDGALYVDLESEGLQNIILRRSDGASLYATRDLAAAIYRHETFDFAKCLYVVAYQQNLHFKQVFAILKKAGCQWADNLEHVAYGMVSIDGQALSTREGNVVFLEDAIYLAIRKAQSIIAEKGLGSKTGEREETNTDNSAEINETAKAIGIGALVFAPLFNSRIKDVDFNYDRALSFEGDTSVYIQYTYARANTVLAKANYNVASKNDMTNLSEQLADEYSYGLIKSLSGFNNSIETALQKSEPSFLARQVLDIAKKYNAFYTYNRILDAEEIVKAARLHLTQITMDVLKLGLELLGIKTVERM